MGEQVRMHGVHKGFCDILSNYGETLNWHNKQSAEQVWSYCPSRWTGWSNNSADKGKCILEKKKNKHQVVRGVIYFFALQT